ncbi:Mss4-like protein [Aspergillus welwitschiae]|uniref:Mss4-like protein n=1 Tax=Aspergillus welwitschiae TaxID=1341132 RepID=A0A3F3PJX7_9EURO|nr:Mss4-like protein [Aspergillus welwitschiae]RDH27250.1 Mss4-like protein [Aspergillus welwitschiae]
MPLSGHCLCKVVTYTVDIDAPLLVGYDHCDDCQRQSGSTYSLVAVVPKDKLTVNGPLKKWSGTGSSGNAVHRLFCSECGSPIAHDPDAAPEIIALKAGTLDTEIKKTLKPDTEIWTVGKLPFCQEHLAKPFKHMPEKLLRKKPILGDLKLNDGIAYIAVHLYNRAQLANPLRNIVNPLSSEILMSKTRAPMRNTRSQFKERRSQPWTSRRSEPQEREPTAQIRSRVASGDLERSLLLFGGHSLEQLSEIDLEDVLHLLVSGSYPTVPHMDGLSHELTEAMLAVPDDVQRTVWTHPHPDMIPASHDANIHRKCLRFTPPTRGRSYYEKSFVMAGLVDPRTGRPDRVKLSCFRQFVILNSDHGVAFTACRGDGCISVPRILPREL